MMQDLISRQAAIDAILAVNGNSSVRELYEHVQEHGLSDMWSGGVNAAIDIIIAVPSAQPKILAYGEGELNVPDTNVGDIISRKAAIDAVMELFRRVPTNAIRAKKVIEKLPSAQPEQRWIPCSERLPDIKEHHVSEPCIVYCSNGAYGFAELEENIFGQVGWNCERDDDYHEPLGEVLAWMPLPDPYQAERKEK